MCGTMKKYKKIISIILIALLFTCTFSTMTTISFAKETAEKVEEETTEKVEEESAEERDNKSIIEVKSLGVFQSSPNVDVEIKGNPAGTLIQIDEKGNETENTGFSPDCYKYHVYASTKGSFYFGKSPTQLAKWNTGVKLNIYTDKGEFLNLNSGGFARIRLRSLNLAAKKEGTVVNFEFVNKEDETDKKNYEIIVYGVNIETKEPLINGLTVTPKDYYYLPWEANEVRNRIYLPESTEKSVLTFDTDENIRLYQNEVSDENELAKLEGKYTYDTENFADVKIIAFFENDAIKYKNEKTYYFSFIKRKPLEREKYEWAAIDYNPAVGQFVRRKDVENGELDFLLKPTTWYDKYLSLGGFGGYVTFKFKEPINNATNNPYGIDFLVYGNAFEYANNSTPELGNVLVSKDGKEWYTLAGSRHYELMTDWNREATLKNGSKINAVLLAKTGENKIQDIAPNAIFGYADYHACSEVENAQEEHTITGIAGNPYSKEHIKNIGDGFDLSWAVDKDGKPIELDNIQYVRVQTAVDIAGKGSNIGENSVEIGTLSRSVANNEVVGKSSEPKVLNINGNDILSMEPTETISENSAKYYELDLKDKSLATINVVVKGDSGDNISINNEIYETEADYIGLLADDGSRMARIIVQNGNKEPIIYVIKCTGGGDPATNADLESVIMTPGDVEITRKEAVKNAYNFKVQNNVEKVKLEINTLNPESSIKVGGISDNDVSFESGVLSGMIALKVGENIFNVTTTSTDGTNKGTYTIKVTREQKATEENKNNIKVTFTLYGDDKHGENGKHNKQTWIEKTSIEIPKNSTVKYLTDMMLYNAGIDFDDTDGTYISKIKGPDVGWLGEFDNGPNSGWMYRHNGKIADVGYASRKLNSNDKVVWFYTDDYKKETGYEGNWDHINKSNTQIDEVSAKKTIETTAKLNSKGQAEASVSSKEMKDSLNKALEAIKDSKKKLKPEVVVEVKADSKAKSVITTIPTSSGKELAKEKGILSLNTPMGDLTFNTEALETMVSEAKGSDIKLSIEKVDTKKDKVISKIKELSDRPVFNLSATSKDKEITNFNKGKVTFYLPYTLGKNEKKEGLKITYINDEGVQAVLADSSYDEKKKVMKGVTNHFSYYAVTYSNASFDDVTSGKWFYESVMYLVDKGILKGKTERNFAPNDSITRAEFVAILARMSGQTMPDAGNNFTDVKATSWYSKNISWAVNAGIAKGVTENQFAPNAKISRQDMAVMITRYTDYMKKNLSDTNKEIKFTDSENVGNYAKDAVVKMQKAGIINGIKAADGSYSFAPKNNATRAETAKMIYQLAK